MLVQYKATIEISILSVLMGEASTSKVRGFNAAGRWKRKKDETSSTSGSTSSAPVTLAIGVKKRGRGLGS
ncbi:UNVERIFIED_CONTAM: hypothetical protein Slati_2693000 [Sesamum latifolium]|uniref:Uncharacterized protein n=1 Tax=Sesamum latifolium TaxID=2727402 RepID=A0AAW2VVI7_9LAMI